MKKIIAILAVLAVIVLTGMNVWAADPIKKAEANYTCGVSVKGVNLEILPPSDNDFTTNSIVAGTTQTKDFSQTWTVKGGSGYKFHYTISGLNSWFIVGFTSADARPTDQVTTGSALLSAQNVVLTETSSTNGKGVIDLPLYFTTTIGSGVKPGYWVETIKLEAEYETGY